MSLKRLAYGILISLIIISVGWAQKQWSQLNLLPQPYAPHLNDIPILKWRGQGASPNFNTINTQYDTNNRPLTLEENQTNISPIQSNITQVSTPYQLRQAIKKAKPGDLIQLKAGKYNINKKLTITQPATANKPIILFASSLGDVKIEFNTTEGFKIKAPYWTFQNLVIQGTCETHKHCEHAFHLSGFAQGTIIRNTILYDFNAAIKANGTKSSNGILTFSDQVLIEKNTLSNTRPRNTRNPVTPIDIVGGQHWRITGNFISDFIKLKDNKTAYGAFLKGGGTQGIFEKNLIMCNQKFYLPAYTQVGLSLGGGGTSSASCTTPQCLYEHTSGKILNNIIMNCNDVGIYLNKSHQSLIHNNILLNTKGIDARYPQTTALISQNTIQGKIKSRNQATITQKNNNILSPSLTIAPATSPLQTPPYLKQNQPPIDILF